MNRPRLSAAAVSALLALAILAADASAIYNPALGRFIQRDPIGYVDGMNLYEAYRGGPVGRRDPKGTQTVCPGCRDKIEVSFETHAPDCPKRDDASLSILLRTPSSTKYTYNQTKEWRGKKSTPSESSPPVVSQPYTATGGYGSNSEPAGRHQALQGQLDVPFRQSYDVPVHKPAPAPEPDSNGDFWGGISGVFFAAAQVGAKAGATGEPPRPDGSGPTGPPAAGAVPGTTASGGAAGKGPGGGGSGMVASGDDWWFSGYWKFAMAKAQEGGHARTIGPNTPVPQTVAAFPPQVQPRVLAAGDIVRYGEIATGFKKHHGVLDIWATHNVSGYVSRGADTPAIVLTAEQHAAANAVYCEWLKGKTGRPVGGQVDWTKVDCREAQELTERMFDSAGITQSQRQAYYRAFNQYIYGAK